MIAEVTAGLQSLKAAAALVKVLKATSTQAEINEVKLGLQERLLEAQQSLFAAQQTQAAITARIGELEEEIVKLKNWEGEKQRYELKGVDESSFAYVPKPGMEQGEPPHWLCTNCFDNGQKSILQFQRRVTGAGPALNSWRCNRCGGELAVFFHYSPTSPWKPPSPAPPA